MANTPSGQHRRPKLEADTASNYDHSSPAPQRNCSSPHPLCSLSALRRQSVSNRAGVAGATETGPRRRNFE